MSSFYFDKVSLNDYEMKPERYNNDQDKHARLYCVESIGTWFLNGTDNPPISYFKHMNTDSARWAGIVECGDGPLSIQKAIHIKDLAQGKDRTIPYHKSNDNPVVYEDECLNPYYKRTYYEDHIDIIEGDNGSILDVRLEPFPVAFFIHICEQFPVSTFYSRPCIMTGTYEGKPVKGICHDVKQYIPDMNEDRSSQETSYQKTTEYLTADCSGVREDGRKEYAFFNGALGHMCGGYWLEGEEPVVDDNVELIGVWKHLPYVDDGTCVMTDFIFKIKHKTIHFTGKWGLKGWTDGPNNAKHGQSQVMGTFYEGDTPYKHTIFHTFVENMEAYDYKLIEKGYTVE